MDSSRILYEDNHLIAVNKACGEISQGDKTGDRTLGDETKEHIKLRDSKPGNVYLVPAHRLDRPVSGVLLFAKTGKAASRLTALFREGHVEKRYWAIVAKPPDPPAATIEHFLVRDRKTNRSRAIDQQKPDSRHARLRYATVGASDRYTLLEIEMSGGRHHQIRAQLAAIGHPIRGDLKYGYPRSNSGGGISLHARSVSFVHPVRGTPLLIVAPVPVHDTLLRFFERQMDGDAHPAD